MKKIIFITIIVVVAGGIYYWTGKSEPEIANKTPENNYKSISYNIEGTVVKLENGLFETEIVPGSARIVTIRYFGNEVRADFDNDGKEDIAFLLTQSGAGTGTFFYIVAALRTADGYQGTNAIYLGDRIAPQTTEYRDGQIIVNYASRNPGEPFTAKPSVGVSKYLIVNQSKLLEIPR